MTGRSKNNSGKEYSDQELLKEASDWPFRDDRTRAIDWIRDHRMGFIVVGALTLVASATSLFYTFSENKSNEEYNTIIEQLPSGGLIVDIEGAHYGGHEGTVFILITMECEPTGSNPSYCENITDYPFGIAPGNELYPKIES